jgi:hypothetical protein
MLNYTIGLEEFEPERKLYLAVPLKIYEDNFQLSFVQKAIKRFKIRLIVYDSESKKVIKWKKK